MGFGGLMVRDYDAPYNDHLSTPIKLRISIDKYNDRMLDKLKIWRIIDTSSKQSRKPIPH